MYNSPIKLYEHPMKTIIEERENAIFAKIQDNFEVDLDKAELIRALQYDRNQYEKGYFDGKKDAVKWIPVTERLPESEKCVLVYSEGGGVAEGKYNARFNEWVQFRWNVTELRNVTHWMSLPEAPKEDV